MIFFIIYGVGVMKKILLTISSIILAEFKASGIPPPRWTLPPQKYRSFILLEKLACLKKAEDFELDEFPYKDPKYEPVLFHMIEFELWKKLLIVRQRIKNIYMT